MAQPTTAARRYAEASFALAKEEDALDAWGRDLETAVGLLGVPEIARFLDNPAAPFADRRSVVERLLGGDRVRTQVQNLVQLLARRGRISILPAVSAEYGRLLNRERGILEARVTSPTPLGEADLAALRGKVEAMTGATVELTTALDPALIGGLTVRVGDTLIDASVRGRLERLRERLTESAR
jgi:F-type H+-transporting ATPase subunit delta